MSGPPTVPSAQQIRKIQLLVIPVHTVPITLVSVRHSEILKLRAWLRLATMEANRKVEDGGAGAQCLRNKEKWLTWRRKGWSMLSTNLLKWEEDFALVSRASWIILDHLSRSIQHKGFSSLPASINQSPETLLVREHVESGRPR